MVLLVCMDSIVCRFRKVSLKVNLRLLILFYLYVLVFVLFLVRRIILRFGKIVWIIFLKKSKFGVWGVFFVLFFILYGVFKF